MHACSLSQAGTMGPAVRQSRRTIPFFLELTSVHRSGEEVDGEEQGAGGGRSYWNCGGTKAGLTMSAPPIRALFVVPHLRVRESRTERKSGKNAALLCMAGWEAQVGPR